MRLDSMIPEHIRRNFIISELNRIRLLCSNDEEYTHFVCVFYHRLRHRTYSVKFLDAIFTPFTTSRSDLLQRITCKPVSNHTFLVLPFIPFTIHNKAIINSILTPPANIIAQYPSAFTDPSKVHFSFKLEPKLSSLSKRPPL